MSKKIIIKSLLAGRIYSYLLLEIKNGLLLEVEPIKLFSIEESDGSFFLLKKYQKYREIKEDYIETLLEESGASKLNRYNTKYGIYTLSEYYHTIYNRRMTEKDLLNAEDLVSRADKVLTDVFLLIKECYLVNMINEYKRRSRTSQKKINFVESFMNKERVVLTFSCYDFIDILLGFKNMFLKDEEFLLYVKENLFENIEEYLGNPSQTILDKSILFNSFK